MSGRDDLKRRVERILAIHTEPQRALPALLACFDSVFDATLNAGALAPMGSRDSTLGAVRDHYYGSVAETAAAHRKAINKAE